MVDELTSRIGDLTINIRNILWYFHHSKWGFYTIPVGIILSGWDGIPGLADGYVSNVLQVFFVGLLCMDNGYTGI